MWRMALKYAISHIRIQLNSIQKITATEAIFHQQSIIWEGEGIFNIINFKSMRYVPYVPTVDD